jgi:hypothetical protein
VVFGPASLKTIPGLAHIDHLPLLIGRLVLQQRSVQAPVGELVA